MNQYIGYDMIEMIKHKAAEQAGQQIVLCEALVKSVDPNKYMAKVEFQPYGLTSGWLPIGSIAAGPGWGFFHLPPLDTLVTVGFLGGDINNGRVMFAYSNGTDIPPAGIKQGEFLLQHTSGSLLHFDVDGNVNMVTSGDLTATVQGDVQISSQGDLTAIINGDCTIGAQGDLDAIVQGDITLGAVGYTDISSGVAVTLSAPIINLDGSVTFNVPTGGSESDLVMNLAGGNLVANVTGALTANVSGNADISASGTTTLSGSAVTIGNPTSIDGYDFRSHTHSGVSEGLGSTGPVYS